MSTSAQVLPGRLLILLASLASLFLLFSARVQADQPRIVVDHVVVAGDTLWDIAADHTGEGHDVRATISDIKRLNGLESSMIVPGQVLAVPAPADP